MYLHVISNYSFCFAVQKTQSPGTHRPPETHLICCTGFQRVSAEGRSTNEERCPPQSSRPDLLCSPQGKIARSGCRLPCQSFKPLCKPWSSVQRDARPAHEKSHSAHHDGPREMCWAKARVQQWHLPQEVTVQWHFWGLHVEGDDCLQRGRSPAELLCWFQNLVLTWFN